MIWAAEAGGGILGPGLRAGPARHGDGGRQAGGAARLPSRQPGGYVRSGGPGRLRRVAAVRSNLVT